MKTNLMLAVLVMAGSAALAQHRGYGSKDDHDPKERAAKSAERMKKELSLSEDQFSKVKTSNEKFSERYAAIRKDTSLTRGKTMSKMKSVRTEQETELKKILTSDQWTKWSELKSKRSEERRSHFRGRHRGNGSKSKSDNG
jgi:protein CpxP